MGNTHQAVREDSLVSFRYMKAIELIQFSAKALKALTKLGIRTDDVQYINLWFDYHKLVAESGKKTYAEEVIAQVEDERGVHQPRYIKGAVGGHYHARS